jgi:hypothetical protein
MSKVTVSLSMPSNHTIRFEVTQPIVRIVEDGVLLVDGHGATPELAGAFNLKNVQSIVVEDFRASD